MVVAVDPDCGRLDAIPAPGGPLGPLHRDPPPCASSSVAGGRVGPMRRIGGERISMFVVVKGMRSVPPMLAVSGPSASQLLQRRWPRPPIRSQRRLFDEGAEGLGGQPDSRRPCQGRGQQDYLAAGAGDSGAIGVTGDLTGQQADVEAVGVAEGGGGGGEREVEDAWQHQQRQPPVGELFAQFTPQCTHSHQPFAQQLLPTDGAARWVIGDLAAITPRTAPEWASVDDLETLHPGWRQPAIVAIYPLWVTRRLHGGMHRVQQHADLLLAPGPKSVELKAAGPERAQPSGRAAVRSYSPVRLGCATS